MKTKPTVLEGLRRAATALTLTLVCAACPGGEAVPAEETVLEGDAPALRSWSGSTDCCGEDPHPVHGAVLGDGSVALVGKAAAGSAQTAGFLTRWTAPEGPPSGRFVDEDASVIRGTLLLESDSALLQVAAVSGVLVAVGFEADSASAVAHGLALALDPDSLAVLGRLHVTSPEDGRSAALESLVVEEDGGLVLGGSWGLTRDQMEGFKSYGNVVGGRGLLLALDLDDWLAASSGGAAVGPEDVSAEVRDVPEVLSVKSMRQASDGRIFAVASDPDEASGMLRVEPGLSQHHWHAYDDGLELTDLAVLERAGEDDAIALVGHGGPDTIDGHAKLVDPEGEVLWSASFGNPGLQASDTPAEGLAPDAFLFDECWGVAAQGEQLVVACGTGIEGCDAVPASAEERLLCSTDPRRAWRSYMVGLTAAGEVAWTRAESFVDEAGEAAESAAEFVVTDGASTFYGVVDQNFGVGLARFGE